MWSLVPLDTEGGGPTFNLLVGKKYTLGRQSTDFVITNDKSISRVHATLEVTHPETNVSHPHKPPVFTVRDSSKFGTVIRNNKFVNAEQPLNHGETVKFGTVTSVYRAVYEPYVVTTSCLDPVNKKQTKTVIIRLGGHVVSDWRRECQLLIMTNLRVTVKVICALVSLRPIVTVQYLDKLAECIDAKLPLPDPEDYTPPLAESQLNPNEVSFKKDRRRQTLFRGKVFIFLNPKQFKKLNVAVELAGGTPMLMEEGTDDNKDDILVEETSCVMHADPSDASQQLSQNAHDWVQHVLKVLKRHGRRAIPDSELGFAVLYCSTERFCNPSMEPLPNQGPNLPSQSISQQVMPPSQSQVVPSPSRQGASRQSVPAATSADRFPGRGVKPGPSTSHTKVQVKEEPVSQRNITEETNSRAVPATGNLSKKRARDDSDDDEGTEINSKSAKIPRIKEEIAPTPPRRSTRRSPSPAPARSPSPAPAHRGRSRRGADSPETSSHSPSPSPRRPARSPSPAPRRSPRSPAPATSPEPSPVRGRARGRARAASRSPSPAPTPGVSPKSEALSDDQDEFDAFKPRSRRNARTQEKPSPPSEQRKAEDGQRQTQEAARDTHNTASPKNTTKRKKVKREDSEEEFGEEEPARRPAPNVTSQKPLADIKDDISERVQEDGPVLTGFLSARIPVKNEAGLAGAGCPDVDPDAGTVTVSVSLTVPRRQRPTVIAENNNTINGSAVKNFKKFKKVACAGSSALPRILGGSDLRPHNNDARGVEAWFEEERKEEERQASEDRLTDALFSWEPTSSKKKIGGRRR